MSSPHTTVATSHCNAGCNQCPPIHDWPLESALHHELAQPGQADLGTYSADESARLRPRVRAGAHSLASHQLPRHRLDLRNIQLVWTGGTRVTGAGLGVGCGARET